MWIGGIIMTENVIILGAGASCAEGAPPQKELFNNYFHLEDFWDKKREERLESFFKTFFGVDFQKKYENYEFPTFEEAIGVIELALNRNESFRLPRDFAGGNNLQKIRDDLVFLIAEVLDRAINPPEHQNDKPGNQHIRSKNQYHKMLVDRLHDDHTIQNHAFLDMNYDILMDNALMALNQDHSEFDLDYGIEFINFEEGYELEPQEIGWEAKSTRYPISLYKPHGSLNWLFCPTCISLELVSKDKEKRSSELKLEAKECKRCGTDKVPILIPPTFFKVMSNYYLQRIWHDTERALESCKRIIFCGYSLPDADMHIRYLLKRSELKMTEPPEILIFNRPEIEGGKNNKSNESKWLEKERFFSFFKDYKRVNYTNRSFQDFCKNGLPDK